MLLCMVLGCSLLHSLCCIVFNVMSLSWWLMTDTSDRFDTRNIILLRCDTCTLYFAQEILTSTSLFQRQNSFHIGLLFLETFRKHIYSHHRVVLQRWRCINGVRHADILSQQVHHVSVSVSVLSVHQCECDRLHKPIFRHLDPDLVAAYSCSNDVHCLQNTWIFWLGFLTAVVIKAYPIWDEATLLTDVPAWRC